MPRNAGFTLIELIVVVVLLGIMAAGAGLLITRPIEAYTAQVNRQHLVDAADIAARKLASDIRRSLPNSIRTSNSGGVWVLEMVNVVAGASFRDKFRSLADQDANDVLEFGPSADNQFFNIMGTPDNLSAISASTAMQVVIANPDTTIYSQAASIAGVASATLTSGVISRPIQSILADVVAGKALEYRVQIPRHRFTAEPSPSIDPATQPRINRLFVVDGPISYVCDPGAGALYRAEGYGFQSAIRTAVSDFNASEIHKVASQVASCQINYAPGTPTGGGLVTLRLLIQDAQGEHVSLLHQVQVNNVP